jgi:hypothetical protein
MHRRWILNENASVSGANWMTSVTRLGDYLLWAVFFNYKSSPYFRAVFSRWKLCINFSNTYTYMVWATFWAFFHQTHLVILPLCQASQIIFAKMFWASQQLCISSENRHLHMYYKIDYFVNSKIFYKDIRKITRCLHNIVNIITSVVGSLSTCIEMY